MTYPTCFCGEPLPPTWIAAMWCDSCLDEWAATGPRGGRMDAKEFIVMKKAARV